MNPAQLKRLYNAFSPDPLRPDQFDSLYVNVDEARGNPLFIKQTTASVVNSDEPICRFLSGHRGCGKSTELRRLATEIQRVSSNTVYVSIVDVPLAVDLNDLDFPDLLLAILRGLIESLPEHVRSALRPGYLGDRLSKLKCILPSGINFESVDINTALVNLTASIKESPDARKKVREALEPDTSNLLEAGNALIGDIVSELHTQSGQDRLLLVIDGLDKLTSRHLEHARCRLDEYLFGHRSPQLFGFKCDIVYTMPISLAYSTMINKAYGDRVPSVLPMIKVADPVTGEPVEPGRLLARELVDRRVKSVDVLMTDLFENDHTIEHLIARTGGQPRILMTTVQAALSITDSFPLGIQTIDRVLRELRETYRRMLTGSLIAILKDLAETGDLVRDDHMEDQVAELLYTRAILQYDNGEAAYTVNPVVCDLLD